MGGFPAGLCAAAKYYTLVANAAMSLGTDTPLASTVRTLVCKKGNKKEAWKMWGLDQRSSFPPYVFLHTDL